jgi:hypothetical protein
MPDKTQRDKFVVFVKLSNKQRGTKDDIKRNKQNIQSKSKYTVVVYTMDQSNDIDR